MKRVPIILLFSLTLLSSCGRKDGGDNSESARLRKTAAKAMNYRMRGDVDAYLRMTLNYERLPKEYQSQLRDLMLQHQANEQSRMGRLTATNVVGDTLLGKDSAEVYVEMVWNDSIKERIHLPLIRRDNRWWLQ